MSETTQFGECLIVRYPNFSCREDFFAVLPLEEYKTLCKWLGTEEATYDTEVEYQEREWDTRINWSVEASSLDEAIKKIAAEKQAGEEAHQRLEAMHRQHWAEHGGPIRLG